MSNKSILDFSFKLKLKKSLNLITKWKTIKVHETSILVILYEYLYNYWSKKTH